MTTDLVGKTLGDYRLDEVIGEGGMALVYKAYQLSLNRWVAVKVLHYREDTSLERFRREAKAVAGLRHRNILIIYEYGEEDGSPFIAMEYIDGGTLEDLLGGKPMEWRRVIGLVIPVAEALHYAHQQGIIHRDVKPSNILMPQEDWPVLADFGLVKRSDEETGLTVTGTFMGTPSYIAPEQARDIDLDFRADMYSLGVIMFEMVTGKLPFDYENPNKILLAHVKDAPPKPRDLNPDCPPALEAAILKTLEKSSSDRYKNMQELVQALQAILVTSIPDLQQDLVLAQKKAEKAAQQAGVGGFFKKMFGRKEAGETPREDDISSKTAPQKQVAESLSLADEFEGTVQLDLGEPVTQLTPRLVVQDKNATIILPDKDSLIIGRTYGNSVADIDLEPYEASKYGVSRRHARLTRRNDCWFIEDLNSLNGTLVNDVASKNGQPLALNEGDRVRLSHMNFVFLLA